MRAGKKLGGPVADPIRQMLDTKNSDGVIFKCRDEKDAENTRYAAIMLKCRNNYDYKTMRRGDILTVYKPNVDPFEMHSPLRVVKEHRK